MPTETVMQDHRVDRILDILDRLIGEVADLASDNELMRSSAERRILALQREVGMLQNEKPDDPVPYGE